MAVFVKNGKKDIKNYLNAKVDTSATIKYKKGILVGLKLNAPLFSWPKDKLTLLSIINTYLANIQLSKLNKDKTEEIGIIDELLGAVGKAMADADNSDKNVSNEDTQDVSNTEESEGNLDETVAGENAEDGNASENVDIDNSNADADGSEDTHQDTTSNEDNSAEETTDSMT